MIKKISLIVLLFLNINNIFAQKSDTLELNLHSSKKILPKEIEENSGLLFYNNLIFTFNDSQGKTEIYGFDPQNGIIKNTIFLKNAKNIDWEAITTDGTSIYIGDFGNNRGNRKDLTIYTFSISSINFNLPFQEVETSLFTFEIDGQTSFENKNRKNDFDIESMVYYNDKIHFFTKEWLSLQTAHHTLELNLAHQISKRVESFPTGYLVTDAFIDQNILLLVGYTKESIAFLSQFKIEDQFFFKQPLSKTYLGLTPGIGQIEGVSANKEFIFLSGESMQFGGFNHEQAFYTISKL
ncbi:MAG: hypothetical protein ACOVQ2_08925 [Flavobacterium sp.]